MYDSDLFAAVYGVVIAAEAAMHGAAEGCEEGCEELMRAPPPQLYDTQTSAAEAERLKHGAWQAPTTARSAEARRRAPHASAHHGATTPLSPQVRSDCSKPSTAAPW
jgi:hypothetical protein